MKMRLFLSTLFVAVLLSACNDAANTTTDETTTDENVTLTPDRANAPAEDIEATLGSTVDALRGTNGDLTALAPRAAVSTIDAFSGQLSEMEGTEAVTTNLDRLRDELTSDKVNAPKTGMILLTLADESKRLIGVGNAGTNALINSLMTTGNRLMEGALSEDSMLGQTLKAIKDNNLSITSMSRDAATNNIDAWIAELEPLPGTTDITTELRGLKMELYRDEIDGSTIAGHLKNLAAQTEAVADGNVSLEALAYALKAGAWKLEGK